MLQSAAADEFIQTSIKVAESIVRIALGAQNQSLQVNKFPETGLLLGVRKIV